MPPGRIGRFRFAPAFVFLGVACLLSACVSDRAPHRELAAIWREYRALPDERALAIAGELRRERWVAGVSAGHASRAGAEAGALQECRVHRQQQRMQSPCHLYAVGDEVVWRGR